MSCVHVPVSLYDLIERKMSIDNGSDFSSFYQFFDEFEICFFSGRNSSNHLFSSENRGNEHLIEYRKSSGNWQTDTLFRQGILVIGEIDFPHGFQDEIVAFSILRKVFLGIVDNEISSERFYEFEVRRTANAGNLGSIVFCELHRGGSNGPRSSIDEYFLSWPYPPFVPEEIQSGRKSERQRGCLVETHTVWHEDYG